MNKRICVICGEEFEPKSSRRKFCYKDHFHPCPVCGKDVLTTDLQHLNSCCCLKHSRQLATSTIHAKYEVWPTNSVEATEKRKQTFLERFGVDNPSKNDSIKSKISSRVKEEFAKHPEYKERARQTYFEKTGYYHSLQNPAVQESIKKKNLEKYGVEWAFQSLEFKKKADETNLKRYGTVLPMQNPDVLMKYRSQRSKHKAYDGTKLDSSYEVAVYEYCIRNGIPIQRTYPIKYDYLGEQHTTFIDFVIDGLLVEVKGEHALEGYYDSQPGAVPISRKLEIYRENNVVVITGSAGSSFFKGSPGFRYANEENKGLIGVDIDLFREPEFPYPDNRPECFYDVKVSGEMSCHDAFFDEKTRWDMIKNRIQYTGDFIQAKDIVRALNVTRRAKQPSWFAKSFAEKLIKKYCTSDVIVDTFAGWGTRHDAAVGLHKYYIGIDASEEVVNWHRENHRNIKLGDAKTFTYQGDCNVLICPPYRDTEIYFDGQDCELSECDWLEIVMKNVPNASRYIMVCKEVSDKYKPFIVDQKVNKSHLNTNTEYVLVVDSSDIH